MARQKAAIGTWVLRDMCTSRIQRSTYVGEGFTPVHDSYAFSFRHVIPGIVLEPSISYEFYLTCRVSCKKWVVCIKTYVGGIEEKIVVYPPLRTNLSGLSRVFPAQVCKAVLGLPMHCKDKTRRRLWGTGTMDVCTSTYGCGVVNHRRTSLNSGTFFISTCRGTAVEVWPCTNHWEEVGRVCGGSKMPRGQHSCSPLPLTNHCTCVPRSTCMLSVAGSIRRALHGTILLVLATIATLPSLAAGFSTAPHLVRNELKAVPRSMIMRPRMKQSPGLELVEDAGKLPGIAKAVFEQDARPVLLYDGVCNMCNGFVNLFLDVDTDKKFRFSALQSQTGRALLSLSGRSPDDISRCSRQSMFQP